MKIICFDLDGTLCTEERTFLKQYAKPHQEMINLVNDLYDKGNQIIIYTGRHSLEWQSTVDWLTTHKVKYHQLILNKPFFDYYICDKAISYTKETDIEEILKKIQL